MEEEISDRELRVKTKKEFDRLLPEGGINSVWTFANTYKIHYVDVNDMPGVAREATLNIEKTDPCKAVKYSALIVKGPMRKQFRVFAYFENQIFGMFTFREMMDNPHGYGPGDFLLQKYIYPEFRNTKMVRLSTSDLNHLLFKSDTVKRLYAYMPAKDEIKETDQLWDVIDKDKNPGMSKIFNVDGPQTQIYISIPQILDTPQGKFAVLEIDGKKFNEMDEEWYHHASTPGLKEVSNKTYMKEEIKRIAVKKMDWKGWHRGMDKNIAEIKKVREFKKGKDRG